MNIYKTIKWVRESKKRDREDATSIQPIQQGFYGQFPQSFTVIVGLGYDDNQAVLYGLREEGKEPFQAFTGHRGWGKRIITPHSTIDSKSSDSPETTQSMAFESHGGLKRDIYRYEALVGGRGDLRTEVYEWRSDPEKPRKPFVLQLFRNAGNQGEGEAVAVWREADPLKEGRLGDFQLESTGAMDASCTLASIVSILTICHMKLMASVAADKVIEQAGKVASKAATLGVGFGINAGI